ncbi:transport protein 56 (polysaccharide biosynthesis transport protein) [Haloarcula japonica DSM 6131]|uniref:Transport protein 56 (Polysaccharide biosynthesis transport protein) n=2 Tax=Haloarcula japonica TaxID=29282 RepID=M0LI38_HALJT|nr:transport protein 56 (polysaccharide biosynthesis transport protein) [Haloarcula japonica DSM 6131]
MDILATLSRGASLHVVGKIFFNVFGFLLHLVLSRGLGAGLYGIYAYGKTLSRIAIVFTNLGSDQSVLKYLPEYSDDAAQQRLFFGLSVLTSLVGSIVAAAVLAVYAPVISNLTIDRPEFIGVLRLFAIITVFDTLARIIHSSFRGLERLEYEVLSSKISRPILRLIGVVGALSLGYSLTGVMVALVVASGLVLGIASYLLLSRFELRPWISSDQVTRSSVFEYYNFSIPLTMKNAADILIRRVDIFMVGLFFSSTVVGYYNISLLIAGFLTIPLMGFNQLFPPIASRLYMNGEIPKLNSLYNTVTRWVFTISFLMAIGAFVYRAEILSLFGEDFTAGTPVLALFVVGQLFNCLGGPNGYLLMMTERQYVLVVNQWVFGIVNVVLNYVMITTFGVLGAAVATAGVFAMLNIVQTIELWYFERLFPYSLNFLKPLFAGVITTIVMVSIRYVMSDTVLLIIGGLTGVVTYGIVLLAIGIEEDDKEFFGKVTDGVK